ncbi:cytochrome c3 family protein [bacterium]|nr:cytochrome c3 family protein [bacterium]
MSQIFPPGANNIARLSIPAAALILVVVVDLVLVFGLSPVVRAPVGVAVEQPVRFSHELHSGQLNIECAYCHTSVEVAAYAGIPDTHTCMSCHGQIATYSELLAPVRASYETGEPLIWHPVHELVDHVYFNHSAHTNAGFGCETCHGNVPEMPLIWQAESMTMGWCLECHREPERFIRPVSEIYTFGYEPDGDQLTIGAALVEEQGIDVNRLDSCSICHY